MITLTDVGVRYSDTVVGLHPVDLTIAPDQVTVLLGRSGAGKSTLLRTLNLLARPSRGAIHVEGIGVLDRRARIQAHRRRTAMIFQQHQLIGRLTALQNVLVGRIGRYPSWRTCLPMARADRLKALDSLDRVELLDRALDRTGTLSGGQQQRVGIARALSQEPHIILADEPVASLDPASSTKVLGHIREISRQEGIPAVVSLHQLELARSFADRIVGLADGHVVFDGPPDALTAEHLHRLYGEIADSAKPPTPERAARQSQQVDPQPREMEVIG